MNAAERKTRDEEILRLFMAGASYAMIARQVSMTQTRVDQIIKRELSAAARRRTLLTDKALEIHMERTERLFQAHWLLALKGNHRSADLCRKMLNDNAKLQALYPDTTPLPAPTGKLDGGNDDQGEEPMNELDRLRARRQTGS